MSLRTQCVEHTQKGDLAGYGKTSRNGVQMVYHRAVFLDTHGYLPEVVRHICDNPRCINPNHLVSGNQSDNMKDAVERGRHVSNLPQYVPYPRELVDAVITDTRSQRVIAKEHGISKSTVARIQQRGY